MRRTLTILTALAFAGMAILPFASATWNYRGTSEPDTGLDDPIWMYLEPDTDPNSAIHKVYFNAFGRVSRETHYNPNVAATGSRIMPPAQTTFTAILGFWKDCNQDGYVGMSEYGLIEYRSELLLDASVCAPRTPVVGQAMYPHNDGTWVREFIWIGPTGLGAASGNPTNFYAAGTGVWGDWGAPGVPPQIQCPGGNAGARSTGAILELADCQTGFGGVRALNSVGEPLGGWDPEDVDNSDATLNVDNPAYYYLYGPAEPDGHPNEGDYRGTSGGFLGRDTDQNNQRTRMVTIVDCDTNGPDTSPEVNTPGNIMDSSTYPSLYESLNDTFEVATQGGSNRCAPSGPADEGLPYPQADGYSEPITAADGRREVDHPFEFSPGNRNLNSQVRCKASGAGAGYDRHPVLGYCPPHDAGLNAERDDGPIGPAWRTNAGIVTPTMVVRDTIESGAVEPAGGQWMSFYATVGTAALAMGNVPGGGAAGVYGAEACGGSTTGVVNGWHCDPQDWVDRCNDPELPTLSAQCYRVGFAYHLRDVDCWDGTLVRGVPAHASLVDLSEQGSCTDHVANPGPLA